MFERPQPPKLSLVLVEPDRRVRRSLAGILETSDRVGAVATPIDLGSALEQIRSIRPTAVLVGFDGRDDLAEPAEMLRELRSACPGATLIALADEATARRCALAAGADFAVEMTAVAEDVVGVLSRVPTPARRN